MMRPMNTPKRHSFLFFSVPPILFVADRLLKIMVERPPSSETIVLVPDILDFAFFANTGIAFSIPFSGPLLWILSAVLLGVFSFLALRHSQKNRPLVVFFYLLFVFGAISNLYDRIVLGYTVDYLIVFGRSAVNFADGMIVVGAVVLIWRTGISQSLPFSKT